MNVNFGPAVLIVFIILITMIFSTFFASRLAQLKMRSRAWGLLGFFFNIFGLVIVCYLPSKRPDKMQTNPIAHALSRVPSMSKKTMGLLACIAAAAVLTLIAYDNLPTMIQNYKYSKQVLSQNESEYEQSRLINEKISSIGIGTNTTYAISENANVYCWGQQFLPQLEGEDRGIVYKNAQKISSCGTKTAVLTNDGQLYVCDFKDDSSLKMLSSKVTDFSVSETTLGYIKTNGKLYMYGDNSYGQLGTYDYKSITEPEAVLGGVRKVVCEATFTVALQKDGKAVGFGSNVYGQFPSDQIKLSSPLLLSGGIKDIAAGDDFVLLLTDSGEVLAAGNNVCGQLGQENIAKSVTFTRVMSNAESVYAAKRSGYALNADCELYGWGLNNVGQLGNGKTENTYLPEIIARDVSSVCVSGTHTVILTENGKICASGFDSHKQLGKGTLRDTFSEIAGIK